MRERFKEGMRALVREGAWDPENRVGSEGVIVCVDANLIYVDLGDLIITETSATFEENFELVED